jgi:four helix bundle protein
MVLRAYVGKLLVHQLAVELAAEAVKLARMFRGPGARTRGDQLVGAALSICSNIAEACGRGTVPEFRRFLLYARGSAQEVISQLQVAVRADPAHRDTIRKLESRATLISKMIGRLHEHPPPDR